MLRRGRLLQCVVWVLLGVTSGCGEDPIDIEWDGSAANDDGPHPAQASVGDREAAVDATINSIWDAVGIDPDDRIFYGYARDSGKMSKPCMHLPEVDRWLESKTSSLAGERATQDHVYESAVRFLADEGYNVKRYESAAPGTNRLTLRAEKNGVVVTMDVESNGMTDLKVSVGPCAASIIKRGPPMDERVG